MKINKIITPFLLFVFSILLLTILSCERQNNYMMKGKIIGYEHCTNDYYGYLIEVQSPADIGGVVSINGTQYENVVKTYSKPNAELPVGSEIKGRYQMTPNCRICEDFYLVYDLPEVQIIYKH